MIVIGEGEKDEAPMLYNGEVLGTGDPPRVDIAVDPIDGTRLTSVGGPGAVAVVALSERGSMYAPGQSGVHEQDRGGPDASGHVDIDAPVEANLKAIARAKGRELADLTVTILDRPRHADLIAQVRQAWAPASTSSATAMCRQRSAHACRRRALTSYWAWVVRPKRSSPQLH